MCKVVPCNVIWNTDRSMPIINDLPTSTALQPGDPFTPSLSRDRVSILGQALAGLCWALLGSPGLCLFGYLFYRVCR